MKWILTFIFALAAVGIHAQNYPELNKTYGIISRNDQLGTAKFELKISRDGVVYIPGDRRNLRIVWPNGDSISKSWQAPGPGTFTLSVKDITLGDTGVFVKGLPDAILTEVGLVLPCATPYLDNDTIYRFRCDCSSGYVTRTLHTYYRCHNLTCDTIEFHRETPLWRGYWSGMIDKIKVTYAPEPVIKGGKILTRLGNIIWVNRWRVYHI